MPQGAALACVLTLTLLGDMLLQAGRQAGRLHLCLLRHGGSAMSYTQLYLRLRVVVVGHAS